MRALLLLLAAGCASAPREEVVGGIPLVHIPVEGTPLRPYALGKYETTWKDFLPYYRADIEENRSGDGVTRPSLGLAGLPPIPLVGEFLTADKPVVLARWHTAMSYCDWLTAKTGRKFRLPTHSEWGHAARLGKNGKGEGWHAANSFDDGTRPPGRSKPDALGLHDMLGNVWEPVLDVRDLLATYRGGAWNSAERELSADTVFPADPEWWANDPWRPRSLWWYTDRFCQGLRVACVGDEAAMRASADYAPKVGLRILKDVERRGTTAVLRSVSVEVHNGGERTVEELEARVYFLTPKGEPHLLDIEGAHTPGQPTFAWSYPLATPLRPGETREFVVELPQTYDPPNLVNERAFGASATWVRLAP